MADDEPQDEPPPSGASGSGSRRSGRARLGRGFTNAATAGRAKGGVVNDGAGILLGLMVWGWIIVPYVKDGKQGVRDTLSAKFFNKKGGKPLP